jgi:AGZA family xanthine/uracil permease-like MFS transporter
MKEVVGGITTFLTMSYIIVVNPSILSASGMPFSGVLTATVVLSSLMTILMGVYAGLPFAVAPGMGLNAFFTFQIVVKNHVPWPVALGLVCWAGIAFVAVSVTPLRESIARAVPVHLRLAAAGGIGLLLSFIALRNAGIVVADPATLVGVGRLGDKAVIFGIGLAATLLLYAANHRASLLIGIVVATLASFMTGLSHVPDHVFSRPDFSLVGKADLAGALQAAYLAPALGILFTDLFDSLSTFVGVAHATGLTDENGHPRNLGRALLVDALATLGAGLLGTSSGTAYIESAAGIRAGARSGKAAVVCGLCFLPFLFLGPLAAAVPAAATAPALLLVGVFMFASVRLPERIEEAVPAFFTLLIIPLSSSIAQGILGGFVLHVVCFVLARRFRDISLAMWLLSAVALVALGLENVRH